MIFVPHNNNLLYEYSIMEKEVTIGQFKEFVANTGYNITGHNSEALIDKLKNGQHSDPCTHLNIYDVKAFTGYLNQRYARAFQIPLKYEWMMAMAKIGHQLSGDNNEWTEQRLSLDLENRTYLQCNKQHINMLSYIECPSDQRSEKSSVRLIERIIN
jgi:formylglycine-generating enzyme required for sulfatase activity